MDVIIRNVDAELYKRLKAEAALRGMTVAEAFEESVRTWLQLIQRPVLSDVDVNNEAYMKLKGELVKNYEGKYVVFCDGKFVGAADTLDEAGKLVRQSEARRGLVCKLGVKRPAGGEWLWGSIEQ